MEKIKNFIYDKSDLLVAVVIIALAALIIWLGINNIMRPMTETADAQNGQGQAEEPVTTRPAVSSGTVIITGGATTDSAATTSGTATSGAATSGTATTTTGGATGTAKAAKIAISAGEDSDTIADSLIEAKVIKDKNKFYSMLEELGLSSKIQEGTFNIPAGSTLEDVCRIITETN